MQYRTITHCNTLQLCDTLHYTATHCNTLQHTATYLAIDLAVCRPPARATHCNTLQHTVTHCNTATHCNTLHHTATHFNTPCDRPRSLHASDTCKWMGVSLSDSTSSSPPASSLGTCTYVHVLQCVAVCCSMLQCVAVCCSVLQCVAVSE